jgi:RimJ/RimL family protein N-acetyltransferase
MVFMIIEQQKYYIKGVSYSIRSAEDKDAEALSLLRVQLDGETENMDREKGEAYIDTAGFRGIIHLDTEKPRNLFLIAVVAGEIVGYSRCEGTELKRFCHKVEFGVCVAGEFWGHGIGKNLLEKSIEWADQSGVEKMTLNVLASNEKAIELYQKSGFGIEGILKRDRRHADGQYHDTIVMGRFKD